jgi:hypothetical protein
MVTKINGERVSVLCFERRRRRWWSTHVLLMSCLGVVDLWHLLYTRVLLARFVAVVRTVEGEVLLLTNVVRSDMGNYLCIATNGVPPSVSKRFAINVHCEYKNTLIPLFISLI